VVVGGTVVVVVAGTVVVVGGVVVDVVGGVTVVDVEPDGGLTVATADDGPTPVEDEGLPVDEPGGVDDPDGGAGTDPPEVPEPAAPVLGRDVPVRGVVAFPFVGPGWTRRTVSGSDVRRALCDVLASFGAGSDDRAFDIGAAWRPGDELVPTTSGAPK